MPFLGAHMSIAGGYYRAVAAAAELEMDCVQIFTKNNNQWRAKPLTGEDVEAFGRELKDSDVDYPCAHASYLINLASPDPDLWQRSVDGYVVELERAEALGLAGVVLHPGSFTTSSEEAGLERITAALESVLQRTDGQQVEVWLENTAGQGSNLGFRFEQLATIVDGLAVADRVGVCLDSCHLFAAGYPLQTQQDYATTMSRFDSLLGRDRLRAWHLNDSKREFGSRVDRHQSIGEGHLGLDPFRWILNDPQAAQIPMYLETPKEDADGNPLDAVNLATLRGLLE